MPECLLWVAGKDFGSEVKALLLKIEVPKPYTLNLKPSTLTLNPKP